MEPPNIAAIRRLREHGFPVVVAASIDRANIGSLAATGNLLSVDPEFCAMHKSNYQQRFDDLAGLASKADQ